MIYSRKSKPTKNVALEYSLKTFLLPAINRCIRQNINEQWNLTGIRKKLSNNEIDYL